MTDKPRTYVTTYCNHTHSVKTGKPIGHECYILPPQAIELEMAGKYAEAIEVLNAARPLRVTKGPKDWRAMKEVRRKASITYAKE